MPHSVIYSYLIYSSTCEFFCEMFNVLLLSLMSFVVSVVQWDGS